MYPVYNPAEIETFNPAALAAQIPADGSYFARSDEVTLFSLIEEHDEHIATIEATRSAPVPPVEGRMAQLRWALMHGTACRVEGKWLDKLTVQMLISVHDRLNEKNRAKFMTFSIERMCEVGWKVA